MELDNVNCYLYLFEVVEPQLPSPLPRCARCRCSGVEVLQNILSVLVGDLTLSILHVGIVLELVVSVGLGGVGGVVDVGIHDGLGVVAVGAQRRIDV